MSMALYRNGHEVTSTNDGRRSTNAIGDEMSSAFVPRTDDDIEATSFVPEGPSLTSQEFKDECDINVLMAKYDGYIPEHLRKQGPPVYMDLSDVPDLQNAHRIMQEAEAAFMTLPAKVRLEFENDSLRFANYASDPANIDQMREWGLTKPVESAPTPVKVEVINPVAPSEGGPAKKPV